MAAHVPTIQTIASHPKPAVPRIEVYNADSTVHELLPSSCVVASLQPPRSADSSAVDCIVTADFHSSLINSDDTSSSRPHDLRICLCHSSCRCTCSDSRHVRLPVAHAVECPFRMLTRQG